VQFENTLMLKLSLSMQLLTTFFRDNSLRPPSWISGVDPSSIVIKRDVSEDNRFHISHRITLRFHLIQFFFLKRSKKAFYPCVIIAASCAAHALNGFSFSQTLSKSIAREIDYTSHAYRSKLASYHIKQSFSSKGCPYDNAPIESFHAILKKEMVYRTIFKAYEDAKSLLFQFIEWRYNRNRIHSAIGYKTP
jgi:hypothetical protein